jgi:hypothetical protein
VIGAVQRAFEVVARTLLQRRAELGEFLARDFVAATAGKLFGGCLL